MDRSLVQTHFQGILGSCASFTALINRIGWWWLYMAKVISLYMQNVRVKRTNTEPFLEKFEIPGCWFDYINRWSRRWWICILLKYEQCQTLNKKINEKGTWESAYLRHAIPDRREHIEPIIFLKYHAISSCESRNSYWLVGDQILISCNKMQINYLKIILWFSGFLF